MAKISISEAARQWNVSRSTLYNKINSGELSVLGKGKLRKIDTSEMLRVFGNTEKNSSPVVQTDRKDTSNLSIMDNPLVIHLKDEIKFLREQNKNLSEQLASRETFEQKLLENHTKKRSFWNRNN